MSPGEILAAYRRLAAPNGLPQLGLTTLDRVSENYHDPQALWAAVEAFEAVQGWFCAQSRVVLWLQGEPPAPSDEMGLLLSCECVNRAGGTLSVRQNGNGGWRLTILSEQRDGEQHLVDEIGQLVVHDGVQGMAQYRRYWRANEYDRGYLPFAARLVSIQETA